jgi:hypothetical protein
MPHAMSPERAQILSLEALTWLVAEPDALARFLAASGVSGADLREAAGSPELNLAILDFLLANETLLLGFCETSGSNVASLHRARHMLQPEAEA